MASDPFPAALTGLGAVADRYDALVCDIWGVLHDGRTAFPTAVTALQTFRARGGRVVLVTNAPRPAGPIRAMLKRVGVPDSCFDALVSSGDVCRHLIQAHAGQIVHHVGPQMDLPLFKGLPVTIGPEGDAVAVVVSDLDDDRPEPTQYDADLARWRARGLPLICANPDKLVEEGGQLVWCGGALADLYEAAGGTVQMAGKPFAPIYDEAFDMLAQAMGRIPDRTRVLAIGDSVRTDATGAARQGLDFLFITGAIHAHEVTEGAGAVADLIAPSGARLIGYQQRLSWD